MEEYAPLKQTSIYLYYRSNVKRERESIPLNAIFAIPPNSFMLYSAKPQCFSVQHM